MSFLGTLRRICMGLAVAIFAYGTIALESKTPSHERISASATEPVQHWQVPRVRLTDTNLRAIELKRVDIRSEVFGAYAWTRVELALSNPNARQLEGELQFPLLDGQIVSGFALDINGQLRDAVSVPKARGQEIFEDIRRRQIDPALLEATAGNQYKLRVYPIPANGERRVVLTMAERLQLRDGKALFRLPLHYGSTHEPVRAEIFVKGVRNDSVQVRRSVHGIERVGYSDAVRFHGTTKSRDASTMFEIAVADLARDRVAISSTQGKNYFVIETPFDEQTVRRPDPKHIALIWDASGSAREQSRALSVLDAFFRSLRTPVRVSLLVVRNRVSTVREFYVAPNDASQLIAALRSEPFDGSSNFDQLPIPKDADLTVFVSDGLATDGQRDIGYRHSAPLIALKTAAAVDAPRLRRIAEASGGSYVDASSGSADSAATAMWRSGWRVSSMESASAESLAMPTLAPQGGLLQVAGILRDRNAKVKVILKHPTRGERSVVLSVIESDLKNAETSPGPAQLWAQWRIAELSASPQLHARQMERISSEHGLIGPNSSLIVLELASDYAQYELPAPPELRAEVDRLRATQARSREQTQSAHIDRMVAEFDTRQRWWERSFPKDSPKPIAISTARGAMGNQTANSDVAPRRALADRDSERREFRAEERQPMQSKVVTLPAPAAAAAPVAPPAPATPAPPVAGAPMELARLRATEPAKRQQSLSETAAPVATAIELKAWSPDTPYLSRLRNARDAELYMVYLDERESYRESSAFFLDVAAHFFERKQPDLALRILSNLAEMNLENRQLLRLYAYRLSEAKQFALATPVFERVAQLAPNEPQSWRDLALAHADNGILQPAIDHLWTVVSRPWNGRFAGINMIALSELNAIVANAKQPIDTSRIDRRLLRNMPLDLRVVMAWDTDDTDIDLHVIDPNGETSSYAKRLSYQGAAMSPDATGGYGPEEFALREAKRGVYAIKAQFYGHRQQVLSAGTTVMVRVTTGFGTPQAKDQWITLRLTRVPYLRGR
ncbi:MAG: VIT domain-containing protein [Casimicrobium sp.]